MQLVQDRATQDTGVLRPGGGQRNSRDAASQVARGRGSQPSPAPAWQALAAAFAGCSHLLCSLGTCLVLGLAPSAPGVSGPRSQGVMLTGRLALGTTGNRCFNRDPSHGTSAATTTHCVGQTDRPPRAAVAAGRRPGFIGLCFYFVVSVCQADLMRGLAALDLWRAERDTGAFVSWQTKAKSWRSGPKVARIPARP